MTTGERDMLKVLVKADESFRAFVYDDATGLPIKAGSVVKGNPTIGYGLELSKTGISEAEANVLLDNRLDAKLADLMRVHPDVLVLDPVRQIVLGNMAFNLGVAGLSGFHQMWDAISRGNWTEASAAMLDSAWAQQVGKRATRLAAAMKSGALGA